MKKKLIFLTCFILCLCLITACSGKSSEPESYGGMSVADLESRATGLADELTGMKPEDVMQAQLYYSMYGSQEENGQMFADLLTDWSDVITSCGDFSGYGEFTVEKSGKTVTATLPINYSKRNVELVFVYNAFDMELTAVNVNMIYTLGETMQKAGLNTVMGIGVVFIILILISLLISCFKVIPMLEAKFTHNDTPVAASPESLAVVRASEQTQEEETDDSELIAVIAAAIAASTGTSTDSFVVRSIRRV